MLSSILILYPRQNADPSVNDRLDSNLKKHTSLLKKLKTQLNQDSLSSIFKDCSLLKLEKYLSEITASIVESRLKTVSEIWAATQVSSYMHQRFPGEFMGRLLDLVLKPLGPAPEYKAVTEETKEKEESLRLTKQRSLIRFLVDMWIVGLVDAEGTEGITIPTQYLKGPMAPPISKKAISEPKGPTTGILLSILRPIFGKDPQFLNLPLAVSFVKAYGDELLGSQIPKVDDLFAAGQDSVLPAKKPVEKELSTESLSHSSASMTNLVPELSLAAVKSVLVTYYDTLIEKLVNEHKRYVQISRSNTEILFNRGSLTEEKQEKLQDAKKLVERLRTGAEVLSLYLSQPLPLLKDDDNDLDGMDGMVISVGAGHGGAEIDFKDSLWEDEESKNFYEDVLDLKDVVPGIFLNLKDTKQDKEAEASETGVVADAADDSQKPFIEEGEDLHHLEMPMNEFLELGPEIFNDDDELCDDEYMDEEPLDSAEATFDLSNFTLLLDRLTNAVSVALIDQCAVDFCYLNGGKGLRNKLARFLLEIPKNRSDLIPYWSRLVAILAKYFVEFRLDFVSGVCIWNFLKYPELFIRVLFT